MLINIITQLFFTQFFIDIIDWETYMDLQILDKLLLITCQKNWFIGRLDYPFGLRKTWCQIAFERKVLEFNIFFVYPFIYSIVSIYLSSILYFPSLLDFIYLFPFYGLSLGIRFELKFIPKNSILSLLSFNNNKKGVTKIF